MNQANQNDWPKEIRKKCPINEIQTTVRMKLRNFPSESAHLSIHADCTLFPPNKYFTFLLCGNSLLQSQRASALVTDRWSSG